MAARDDVTDSWLTPHQTPSFDIVSTRIAFLKGSDPVPRGPPLCVHHPGQRDGTHTLCGSGVRPSMKASAPVPPRESAAAESQKLPDTPSTTPRPAAADSRGGAGALAKKSQPPPASAS